MNKSRLLTLIHLLIISFLQLTAAPQDQQVFTDFEDVVPAGEDFIMELDIGENPFRANFQLGFGIALDNFFFQLKRSGEYIWAINNGLTSIIIFETPALGVQFYAASFLLGDGSVEVYDTNNNLLTSVTEIPSNINPEEEPDVQFLSFNANELGAEGGIGYILLKDDPEKSINFGPGFVDSYTAIDDFGFTPIANIESQLTQDITITDQPESLEAELGAAVVLYIAASGDDLNYQWYTGNSGDTTNPIDGAIRRYLFTSALPGSTNYWVQITNADASVNSDTAVITVGAPSVPLVLDGTGDIAGENIQHPNGNVFDQILLTGESIQLQARPNQITRVSFMDEIEDIVQVEFSGAGSFTVTLDPATFLSPAIPPRYNQAVEYVTGKPSVVIDGAGRQYLLQYFHCGINQRGKPGSVS